MEQCKVWHSNQILLVECFLSFLHKFSSVQCAKEQSCTWWSVNWAEFGQSHTVDCVNQIHPRVLPFQMRERVNIRNHFSSLLSESINPSSECSSLSEDALAALQTKRQQAPTSHWGSCPFFEQKMHKQQGSRLFVRWVYVKLCPSFLFMCLTQIGPEMQLIDFNNVISRMKMRPLLHKKWLCRAVTVMET